MSTRIVNHLRQAVIESALVDESEGARLPGYCVVGLSAVAQETELRSRITAFVIWWQKHFYSVAARYAKA